METQKYIQQLNELTETLKKQPQYVGFNHRFYVPGWIGFVQQCIVESKMTRAAKKPIYQGKGFYECGDIIIDLVDNACKAKKESVDNFEKNNEDIESLQIVSSATEALDAWINIYPEIAYWMNQKFDDKYITNAVGIIQGNLKESLTSIIDLPKENFKPKTNSSFCRELKAMGSQMLAMICNILVFAAVFGLLATIFG